MELVSPSASASREPARLTPLCTTSVKGSTASRVAYNCSSPDLQMGVQAGICTLQHAQRLLLHSLPEMDLCHAPGGALMKQRDILECVQGGQGGDTAAATEQPAGLNRASWPDQGPHLEAVKRRYAGGVLLQHVGDVGLHALQQARGNTCRPRRPSAGCNGTLLLLNMSLP